MAHLFTPFQLRELTLKNRIVMPPMCQYSVKTGDGVPNDWHYVHYASRAVGGTGFIIMEMTGIEPDGRISNADLGLWSDGHVPAFAKIADAVHRNGAKIAVQLGHAGRKARDAAVPVAPSPIPYSLNAKKPHELMTDEVKRLVEQFGNAARRAATAGMDAIELHGAHGYLIHQFHSPLTNQRNDEYGADLFRFGIEVVDAVRSELPSGMPLIMRVSAVEYAEGGYGLDYSRKFCEAYRKAGVDMFHISSGGEGAIPASHAPVVEPGYQVPLARFIRESLGVPVIAVGLLGEPALANTVIEREDADLVAIGRQILHDPYWPLRAARILDYDVPPPFQYKRAFPK